MKILMLGWEYPPNITGGLGVASHGVAESLHQLGHQVTFLLPKKARAINQQKETLKVMDASSMSVEPEFWLETSNSISKIQDVELGAQVVAYMPPKVYQKLTVTQKTTTKKKINLPKVSERPLTGKYDENLLNETGKFALLAAQYAEKSKPDLVYCHDWPTFKAGRLVKEMTGTPLAIHIHSTEFERNGVFTNPYLIQEEGKGARAADFVFTVSEKTKNIVAEKYLVNKNDITVVPNAGPLTSFRKGNTTPGKKTVAFIGRFTSQKSPGTFIDIARELTSRGHDYEFLMIGDGYLYNDLIDKIHKLNLTDRFKFPGFISQEKVFEIMANVDLVIAPSIDEPFGMVMLEAILQGVPVISSPGSGLSEFIPELPTADRWDVYNCTSLAEKLIEDESYRKDIIHTCLKQTKNLSWLKSAKMINKRITTV